MVGIFISISTSGDTVHQLWLGLRSKHQCYEHRVQLSLSYCWMQQQWAGVETGLSQQCGHSSLISRGLAVPVVHLRFLRLDISQEGPWTMLHQHGSYSDSLPHRGGLAGQVIYVAVGFWNVFFYPVKINFKCIYAKHFTCNIVDKVCSWTLTSEERELAIVIFLTQETAVIWSFSQYVQTAQLFNVPGRHNLVSQ